MKKLFATLVFATLAFALPAMADTVHFDGTAGTSQGGVYTAPYFLSINGGQDVSAMCLDFNFETANNETWQANISDLAGDLSTTRQGDAGFATYREAAWLYDQFLNGAGPSGDINFAAWALTAANVKTSSGWTAGAQSWYDKATTMDLTSFDSALVNFRIISPADLTGSGPQEFLNYVPPATSATPEPAGLVLLGSGLLGAAGLIKKRTRP